MEANRPRTIAVNISGLTHLQFSTALLFACFALSGCSKTSNSSADPANAEQEADIPPSSAIAASESKSPTVLLKPTAQSSITIVFHTHWNDANGNQTINSKDELLSEFEGVTSNFTRAENICIAIFLLGLNGSELQFDLSNSSGQQLFADKILIDREGMFAFREVAASELPGLGVYVFRWFFNGQVIHSTAVEITSATKQSGDLPDGSNQAG